MENFLLPSRIEFQPGTNPMTGSLVVSPCYHGYGTTLGNALRRVLLSSLPGGAVESFKIKGIQHEFSTVEGVQEDVVEIILNLKQLAVKVFAEEPVLLTLSKKGAGPITAGDITKDARVEIVNKDLVIANLTGNKTVEMEIMVANGRGYRPVEEKNRKDHDLGTIVIDSVYSPVKDVGYKVEYTRVGDVTNYEKLTINIETDGTITPEEAVNQATRILMDHFAVIAESVVHTSTATTTTEEMLAEEVDEKIATEDAEEKIKNTKKKTTKKK